MPAKGTKTYNKVIAEIRGKLKNFDADKFTDKQIFDEIYNTIAELFSLSGTLHDPKYLDSVALSPAPTKGGLVPESNGATYTNSTKTVYIPTALWAAMFSTGLSDATKLPIGAMVIFYLPVGGDNVWSSVISSITNATSFVLRDAYGSDLTSADLRVAVIFGDSNNLDVIDISAISEFKFITKITSIEDSVNGFCTEKSEKDFLGIARMNADDSPYENEVIYMWRGSNIRFNKGSLPSYGTRTMNIERTPIKPTTYDEYVDYPDTGLKLLEDAVCLTVLQAINAPIPQVLVASKTELNNMRNAMAERRAKMEANAKTQ